MKQAVRMMVVMALILLASGTPAHAFVFVDFVDNWGSSGVLGPGNAGGNEINDGASNPDESWVHDILAEIAPNLIGNIVISDAKLTIYYKDVSTSSETWNVTGDSNALGSFPNFTGPDPTSADFNLTAAALAALQSDGILNVGIEETTSGNDRIRLYQSTLSGNYTVRSQGGGSGNGNGSATPEPSSMLLLGSGLLGFLGFGRSRKQS